jgi:hypothetical protein
MATIEEGLCFSSLGRDIERIDRDLSQLGQAMSRPAGDRQRAIVASRIEATARALGRKLDQQSATFWLLFQDPARQTQANQIHAQIGRMFDRILGLLGLGDQRPGDESLAEKVATIQERCKEVGGYSGPQQVSLPHPTYWRHAPGRDLEADPWSSLVLFSAILFDFVPAVLGWPKGRHPAAGRE